MSRNPYSPPASATTDSLNAEAVRRPISVWILMLVLVACIVLYSVGAVHGIEVAWAAARTGAVSPVTGLWMVVWRVALFAGLALAVVGVHRRHWAGRWLGVTIIVGFALFSIFGPDTTHYASDAERAGGTIGRVIFFPALFAWWAYAYGFSAKAKRYFLPRSARASA